MYRNTEVSASVLVGRVCNGCSDLGIRDSCGTVEAAVDKNKRPNVEDMVEQSKSHGRWGQTIECDC